MCPCCYKKQQKQKSVEEESDQPHDEKRIDESLDGEDGKGPFTKYSTIIHLTNATVVAEPPPIFARFMLRKSVDRLNSEVCFFFEILFFFKTGIFFKCF